MLAQAEEAASTSRDSPRDHRGQARHPSSSTRRRSSRPPRSSARSSGSDRWPPRSRSTGPRSTAGLTGSSARSSSGASAAPRSPDETAYVFRHVLVRDVAYGQIPRARRADAHRRVAEWVESLAVDRPEDLADMVAHHYSNALELARVSKRPEGDLAERARRALRDAGDRAAALNAFAAAARFYGEALALWPEDDDNYASLLFRHGRALFFSADEGEESLARAAEELLEAGDRATASEAETLVGELRWIEGTGTRLSATSKVPRSSSPTSPTHARRRTSSPTSPASG